MIFEDGKNKRSFKNSVIVVERHHAIEISLQDASVPLFVDVSNFSIGISAHDHSLDYGSMDAVYGWIDA